MLAAVEVFRRTAIEVRVLERRGRASEELAVVARGRELRDMASDLEASVRKLYSQATASAEAISDQALALSHLTAGARERADRTTARVASTDPNVQTVGTAAEELAASIREMSRQAADNAELASADNAGSEAAGTHMGNLSNAVDQVGSIAGLILQVAEKTNPLALNATIEAARAGEAGRGFALAASEVKALAVHTQGATGQITQRIASIREHSRVVAEIIARVSERTIASRAFGGYGVRRGPAIRSHG